MMAATEVSNQKTNNTPDVITPFLRSNCTTSATSNCNKIINFIMTEKNINKVELKSNMKLS